MKAIITRANSDGGYDEVGTRNRRIVTANNHRQLTKQARKFAADRAVRIEVWNHEQSFYGDADMIIELPQTHGEIPQCSKS